MWSWIEFSWSHFVVPIESWLRARISKATTLQTRSRRLDLSGSHKRFMSQTYWEFVCCHRNFPRFAARNAATSWSQKRSRPDVQPNLTGSLYSKIWQFAFWLVRVKTSSPVSPESGLLTREDVRERSVFDLAFRCDLNEMLNQKANESDFSKGLKFRLWIAKKSLNASIIVSLISAFRRHRFVWTATFFLH